jgi:hypothetical protein
VPGLIFGIWPGVVAADLVSLRPLGCPPEDTAKTLAALRRLQGTAGEFYVRAYRHFGAGSPLRPAVAPAPPRPRLAGAIGPHNTRRLDYVGLDAFPDVFRPISHQNLTGAVTSLVERFRTVTAEAGVPEATPIHLTETGWPTDDERTEDTQARVLAAVADAVLASGAGVHAYEWFGLRDGLTTATWTARFGVLRDDYTPKPAFAAIQQLIARQTTQQT